MRSKSEGRLLGQGLWSNLFYYLHINYAIAVLSSHSAWLIVIVFQKVGWNVRGVKCPWGEMSEGWNVFGVKCPRGEMSSGWNVRGVKCPRGEMSSGWNVFGVKCTGVKCPGVKCLRGEMSWHHDNTWSKLHRISCKLQKVLCFLLQSSVFFFRNHWDKIILVIFD